MPILKRLTELYERRGILISTGLNPRDFGNLNTRLDPCGRAGAPPPDLEQYAAAEAVAG